VIFWHPASDLELFLCIIAHTGQCGHRDQAAVESVVRQHSSSAMSTDVRPFFSPCVNFLLAVRGETLQSLFGPPVHGNSPKPLLLVNKIETGSSNRSQIYALVHHEDHLNYA
jgi:hypothetical protein